MRHQKGFTLIELMIVVAIIGILASIAYPAYQDYVQQARRTEAMNALSEVRIAQEKWRANHTSFTDDLSGLDVDATTESGFYTVSVSVLSNTQYLGYAIPQGAQETDECKTFVVDRNGVSQPDPSEHASLECWGR
ncbi:MULTISPECIES: type IV pilin protein [unclassified Marinobacterium]|jgi:type IV pilus assembly protein PilE|uniref:type IV pilin protein n=1 Tax=unclassified Marinobacterium TaxID=2644139 RepID=UPI00156A3ED9|nr:MULTISPECIES: type IV pilin protein [unclassified Marinobacterium]NRP09310.1 Fimbrial protein precursor [Marinobacterium sp. xm-g-48]NRP82159.1 Fimbrial protein precursor [Marinobacterium sp. xm-d-509]